VLSVDSVRPALAGEHPRHERAAVWARVWATVAISCFGVSVLVVLALHVALRGEVDPVQEVISDYALFGGAVPFAVSALALGGGMQALLAGVVRAGIPVTTPVRVLAGIFSGGLALCAFFPTNLTGAPLSFSGEVQRLAERIRRWTRWAWGALAAFLASQVPVVLPASRGVLDLLAQGLVERVLFAVYLAPLTELAFAVLRTRERKSC
jgi:hypothetical protein